MHILTNVYYARWRQSQQENLDYEESLVKLLDMVNYEGIRATSFNEWQYIRWMKQEIGAELVSDIGSTIESSLESIESSDIDIDEAQQTTQGRSREKLLSAKDSRRSFPEFRNLSDGKVEILRCHDLPPGLDKKHARCALDGVPCPYPSETPYSRKLDLKEARELWQFHDVLAFFESREDACQCPGQRIWKINYQKSTRPITTLDLFPETALKLSAEVLPPQAGIQSNLQQLSSIKQQRVWEFIADTTNRIIKRFGARYITLVQNERLSKAQWPATSLSDCCRSNVDSERLTSHDSHRTEDTPTTDSGTGNISNRIGVICNKNVTSLDDCGGSNYLGLETISTTSSAGAATTETPHHNHTSCDLRAPCPNLWDMVQSNYRYKEDVDKNMHTSHEATSSTETDSERTFRWTHKSETTKDLSSVESVDEFLAIDSTIFEDLPFDNLLFGGKWSFYSFSKSPDILSLNSD